MKFIGRRDYDLEKDIHGLRKKIETIEGLEAVVNSPPWKDVRLLFEETIASFTQDTFDLCDNPRSNEIEIKCKKMLAEALGRILGILDAKVRADGLARSQLKDRENKKRELLNKQTS